MGSYRSKLMFSLGPISVPVDLNTVIPSDNSGLKRICPDHHQPLNMVNVCRANDGEHQISWGEWLMGAETADGFRVVRPEDRPSHAADPSLHFVPVPADDLEGSTVQGRGLYYANPSVQSAEEGWAALAEIVGNRKVALVCKAALRQGDRKLWRLNMFNGYLVLQEIEFPEHIRPIPAEVSAKVDGPTKKLLKQFVEQMMVAWEKFDHSDDSRQAFEQWIAAGEAIDDPNPKAPTAQTGVPDIQAALIAALNK